MAPSAWIPNARGLCRSDKPGARIARPGIAQWQIIVISDEYGRFFPLQEKIRQ